jgi:hypothetical protein
MSAGNFELGRYESDGGNVYACRVQPESKGLTLNSVANAYTTEAVEAGLGTLALRKGRRGFGVIPRTVTVKMTEAPTGAVADYAGIGSLLTVPVFTRDAWDSYGLAQTGQYLGTAVEYVGKQPEIVR